VEGSYSYGRKPILAKEDASCNCWRYYVFWSSSRALKRVCVVGVGATNTAGEDIRHRAKEGLDVGEHLAETNQKERRDQFFCQLARRHLDASESDKDGWVVVLGATGTSPGYNKREIQGFLERLVEDGWVEVKDQARAGGMHARLTPAGRARAQVICKEAPFAR
jgi:hypothetical protein